MVECAVGEKLIGDVVCVKQDPVGFVTSFYGLGLSMVGMVALIFLVYGGYVIMASRGNPQDVSKGKSYIFYSVIGLLFAIFALVFMEVVIVDILHIPGFE